MGTRFRVQKSPVFRLSKSGNPSLTCLTSSDEGLMDYGPHFYFFFEVLHLALDMAHSAIINNWLHFHFDIRNPDIKNFTVAAGYLICSQKQKCKSMVWLDKPYLVLNVPQRKRCKNVCCNPSPSLCQWGRWCISVSATCDKFVHSFHRWIIILFGVFDIWLCDKVQVQLDIIEICINSMKMNCSPLTSHSDDKT